MNIVVIYSSPNSDGLTAACARAAANGAGQGAGEGSVETVCINDLNLRQCQACDNGWGTCRTEHQCQLQDDFQGLHAGILKADALVLVTPVYWGEMSESAKALTDRLRRCEATRRELTALAGLERWAQHIGMRVFDLIPVNRWSREYKLAAIHAAACAMVGKPETTGF
jgi:multimeric flavodoxin WrbA